MRSSSRCAAPGGRSSRSRGRAACASSSVITTTGGSRRRARRSGRTPADRSAAPRCRARRCARPVRRRGRRGIRSLLATRDCCGLGGLVRSQPTPAPGVPLGSLESTRVVHESRSTRPTRSGTLPDASDATSACVESASATRGRHLPFTIERMPRARSTGCGPVTIADAHARQTTRPCAYAERARSMSSGLVARARRAR